MSAPGPATELTETCRGLLRSPGSRPPEALLEPLAAQSPDAVEAASRHGCALQIRSWLPWMRAPAFQRNVVFRLFFGWSGERYDEFATWSVLASMGPAGFQRITNRPAGLQALLRDEQPPLPEGDAEWIAELLSDAYGQDHGPDHMADLVVRDARSRSGLLTDYEVEAIDQGRAEDVVAPVDPDAWRTQIRPRLARPFAWRTDAGVAVAFSTIDVIEIRHGSPGAFRFRRWQCHIERATHALQVTSEDLGELDCTVRPRPVY